MNSFHSTTATYEEFTNFGWHWTDLIGLTIEFIFKYLVFLFVYYCLNNINEELQNFKNIEEKCYGSYVSTNWNFALVFTTFTYKYDKHLVI